MARYKHLKEKFHLNNTDAKRIDGQIVSYIRTETFRNRNEEKESIRSFIEGDLKNFEIDVKETDGIEDTVQKYINDMDLNLFQESTMSFLLFILSMLEIVESLVKEFNSLFVDYGLSTMDPDSVSGSVYGDDFWKAGIFCIFVVIWLILTEIKKSNSSVHLIRQMKATNHIDSFQDRSNGCCGKNFEKMDENPSTLPKRLLSDTEKLIRYSNRHISTYYAVFLLAFYFIELFVQSLCFVGYAVYIVFVVRVVMLVVFVLYFVFLVSYWSEKDNEALRIDELIRKSKKAGDMDDQDEKAMVHEILMVIDRYRSKS